jgi:tetratricopeptide (TPR) repeat protein/spermidine synthase
MPNDLLKQIFLRDSNGKTNPEQLIYMEEGLTTTVAVFNDDSSGFKIKRLILNGINMSADNIEARKYMTLLSYIPLLLIENPKNVLVICFGTGQTAGAAGVYPGINFVDSVDISPGVFRAGKFFKATNHNVVNNPKVKKIIQDGRQHLLTTETSYDVITAEPPPPMNAGSVNLYTREYYELTKRALKPGGIVSQWIPLHGQAEIHVYQNFRTFLESFPYVMAWYPVRKDLILIGSDRPIDINFSQIERRFENPEINKIMHDIDFPNPFSFLGSIWFLKKELKSLGSGQHVISDNNPSLEFYLNSYIKEISGDEIEKIMIKRASFEDVWRKITKPSLVTYSSDDICGKGRTCNGSTISDAVLAKDAFKKYWDNRPKADHAVADFIRGIALEREGRINEAISHYKTAIKLNPNYTKAYNNLGNALLDKGRISEAIFHYKTAIKLKPDYADAHYNLGNALSAEGKNEEAISHYKTAIGLKPDYALAHNNLGGALVNKGKNEEAVSHYKTAIKLKPDYAKAHYNLGNTLRAEGKNEEAISHYKIAIGLKPDYAEAYNNLGAVLFNAKMTEEAIDSFKEAIRIRPDFTAAQKNLEIVLASIR